MECFQEQMRNCCLSLSRTFHFSGRSAAACASEDDADMDFEDTLSQLIAGESMVSIYLHPQQQEEHVSKLMKAISMTPTRLILIHGISLHKLPALCKALQQSKVCSVQLHLQSITARFTEPLAKLLLAQSLPSTLTELSLSWNYIRDAGAIVLAQGLVANSTLRVLNLTHNEIGDEGCQHLGFALLTNRSLRTLNLYWNRITSCGARELLHICRRYNGVLQSADLHVNKLTLPEVEDFNRNFARIHRQRIVLTLRSIKHWRRVPPELFYILIQMLAA